MSCAGTNTIAALLAGAADPSVADRLEAHLDACAPCRRLVADLGRGLSAIGDGDDVPTVSPVPRAKDLLGRYEIQRAIGAGGMGVVYEAHDTTLDRRVAIKILRPDLLEGCDLLAEAQAMAKLQHPNIATVYDAGIANGHRYVCMELVAGPTLRQWVSDRAHRWRDVVDVYMAAGEGLAYVHRAGFVHRDFKPDNVLVGDDGRVRVTDFGLARLVGAGTADARVLVGTPAYMSPEQRRGDRTDARSDQFAFCVSLREALAGRHTPRWLSRILARGRSSRSADRFATMDDLLAAIGRGLSRGNHRGRAVASVVAAAAIAFVATLPRPTHFVRELVERPVPFAHERVVATEPPAGPPSVASASLVASDARRWTAPGTNANSAGTAARTFARLHRTPLLPEPVSALAIATRDDARSEPTSGDLAERALPLIAGECDDGAPLTCGLLPPQCPSETLLAVQDGCWTCADEQSCASLGMPRTCNDGSQLRCTAPAPACAGRQIAAIRNGCWSCQDSFTCSSRPISTPSPRGPRCGNHVCERGESPMSCAADCATGTSGSNDGSNSGSNGGSTPRPTCGNGFCEIGEDHASCASDCCETDASGACAAVCGNGFCEAGEDHASCAGDCCDTNPSGACAAVCGNGFCEEGETALSCPSECS